MGKYVPSLFSLAHAKVSELKIQIKYYSYSTNKDTFYKIKVVHTEDQIMYVIKKDYQLLYCHVWVNFIITGFILKTHEENCNQLKAYVCLKEDHSN